MPNGPVLDTIQIGNLIITIHQHTYLEQGCDLVYSISRWDEIDEQIVYWFDRESLPLLELVQPAIRAWIDRDTEKHLPEWLRSPKEGKAA